MFGKKKANPEPPTEQEQHLEHLRHTLQDHRAMMAMSGVNAAALGHELGDELNEASPEDDAPAKRELRKKRRKRRRKAKEEDSSDRAIAEREAAERKAKAEEASITIYPWGNTFYPSDQ